MAIKIRYQTEKEDVYDVTVEDNHNFYANEILVHNCSEIILPTNTERTAVCCLSSVNLEYFDEWKDNEFFIRDVAEMLDNVLQYFIDHAPDTIKRAKYSAFRERSIGVGALGFHAYLQRKNVPWESAVASSINTRIFSHIKEKLDVANYELAVERGEAPDVESEIEVEFTDDHKQTFRSSSQLVKVLSNVESTQIRAFELKEGDSISPSAFSYKIDYPREVKSVNKKSWVGRRFAHTSAIAPNACQSKNNIITTSDGFIKLEDLLTIGGIDVKEIEKYDTKTWMDLKSKVMIPTLNGDRECQRVWYNGHQEVYEITFEDGNRYEFTGNHLLMVDLGNNWEWKYVKDITETDIIMTEEIFNKKGYKY